MKSWTFFNFFSPVCHLCVFCIIWMNFVNSAWKILSTTKIAKESIKFINLLFISVLFRQLNSSSWLFLIKKNFQLMLKAGEFWIWKTLKLSNLFFHFRQININFEFHLFKRERIFLFDFFVWSQINKRNKRFFLEDFYLSYHFQYLLFIFITKLFTDENIFQLVKQPIWLSWCILVFWLEIILRSSVRERRNVGQYIIRTKGRIDLTLLFFVWFGRKEAIIDNLHFIVVSFFDYFVNLFHLKWWYLNAKKIILKGCHISSISLERYQVDVACFFSFEDTCDFSIYLQVHSILSCYFDEFIWFLFIILAFYFFHSRFLESFFVSFVKVHDFSFVHHWHFSWFVLFYS